MKDSFNQLEREINKFVTHVLSKHGITMNQIAYSAIGASGVDTKKQHAIITELLKRIGFVRFTLANDAYLGIPAGSTSGTGICAINGTGCTLAGLNKQGDMLQIGGVGMISADVGGGGYLCRRLIADVYRELFRKGEPTIMTKLLFEKLGITNKYDYVDIIYEKLADGSFNLHSCNPMLFEAVKQKDKVASDILIEVAASYASGISGMIEELRFPADEELHIVLAGSVFVKGSDPLLVNSLKEKVSNDNPGRLITYNLLSVPNVAGAVIWALNSLNGRDGYYDKVCAQMHSLL